MIRSLVAALLACLCLAGTPRPAAAQANTSQAETPYVVKRGDTLMSVSSEMLAGGARDYRRLAEYNRLRDPNKLEPGSTLRIPTAWLKRQAAGVRVIAVAGDVRAGERLLKLGDVVAEGETVASGANGYATLEFSDRSVLRVKAQTRVTLEAHRGAPSLAEFETRLKLGAGAIEAAVAKQRKQDFRVITPTANMAVRGTEFRVRGDEAATRTEVTEGRIGVSGARGGEVPVAADFGTLVRQGEAPAAPVRLLGAPDLSRVAELQERPVVRIGFPALETATGYRVVVAEDADLRNVLVETAVRGPLVRIIDLRDGDYFYGVRGVDALGLEGRESRARFRLRARPLPPAPAGPVGDARVPPGPVELSWETAEDVASFRLQVASDERFSVLVIDREAVTGTRFAVENLPPGRYWWRASSRRANGEQGPFGEPASFEVRAPEEAR